MTTCVYDIVIDFEKSKGSYLFDKKSNTFFLDMFSMFSSLPLGYNHEIFDEGFRDKVAKISHLKMCNNLFYSDEFEAFKDAMSKISVHKNIHYCSTGALAVESALKCAFEVSKRPDSIVVASNNSFHGINSWGFITDRRISSVTNRVKNFPTNNWANLQTENLPQYIEKNAKDITSCIIEPIQCTAGDIYLDINLLKEIEIVCKKNNVCFIVDEVQTGFGVTGSYWYSESADLEPDILIFGKKSQISGIMANDKYSEAINSPFRKLDVTFDGDLIDAYRGYYVIKAIERFNLLKKVKENSKVIKDALSEKFMNYRSSGHLIAFDFSSTEERNRFVEKAYDNHLLINPTSDKSVRLRPNLAISGNEIDQLLDKLKMISNSF